MHNILKQATAYIILFSYTLMSCEGFHTAVKEVTSLQEENQQISKSSTYTIESPKLFIQYEAQAHENSQLVLSLQQECSSCLVPTIKYSEVSAPIQYTQPIHPLKLKLLPASTFPNKLKPDKTKFPRKSYSKKDKPNFKIILQEQHQANTNNDKIHVKNAENQLYSSSIFLAQGGHQVEFVDVDCKQAIVKENLRPPFSRKLHLAVLKEDPTLNIQNLIAHSPAWHQQHIQVIFPEKDQKKQGYILILAENSGLVGGMLRKETTNQADVIKAWGTLKDEVQATFGKTVVNGLADIIRVKEQAQSYLNKVQFYTQYSFISSSVNQVINELERLYSNLTEMEENLTDKQNYNAFIKAINNELGPDVAHINQLQDENADPDIIIAAARAAKPRITDALSRLQNYVTKCNKEDSIQTLVEASNKLDEVIRDFGKKKIIQDWFKLKKQIQESFSNMHLTNTEETAYAKLKTKAYKEEVSAYLEYDCIDRRIIEEFLEELDGVYKKIEGMEEDWLDQTNFNAFIEKINSELGPDVESLNVLLKAGNLKPKAILAQAHKLETPIKDAIAQLENYPTKRDKSSNLEKLKKVQEQIKEVVEEYTQMKILTKRYRKTLDHVQKVIIQGITDRQEKLVKNLHYLVDQYIVIMEPKSTTIRLQILKEIFPNENKGDFNLQKLLTNVNLVIKFIKQHTTLQPSNSIKLLSALPNISLNKKEDEQILDPLYLAILLGNLELAQTIVENGTSIQLRDHHNRTCLHYLALSPEPNLSLAKWLLQHEIPINLADDQGNTALSLAIERGHIELTKILVAAGTAVDFIDRNGSTLLHIAACNGDYMLVKYLLEEAKLLLSCIDKQGRTALDIALEKNHTEVVAYLRELAIHDFRAQRAEAEAHMIHQFENELQESLAQMWNHFGINPTAISPETLANEWLNNMQAILEGDCKVPTAFAEGDPSLQAQVDEFLHAIQEELRRQEVSIPEAYREAFRNFPVESLRPYATAFVKQCEEIEKEVVNYAKEVEKEATEVMVEKELEIEKEPIQKEQKTREEYQQVSNLTTERRAVRSTRHTFIPSSKSGNIRRIRGYIQDLQKGLVEISPTLPPLQQKQKEAITFIFKKIQNEQRELKPLYQALKAHAEHRGADILFAQQDINQFIEVKREAFAKEHKILQEYYDKMAKEYNYNIEEVQLTRQLLQELERAYEDNQSSDILFFQQPSRFCELKKEAFEKECAIIQKNIKDVELARSFLEELQIMEQKVCQILKDRNENLADYVGNDYDSDFENDYSDEELVEYLASCGIEPIETQHQAFMRDFRTNLTAKIGFIISKSASNEPISPTLFMKLFYKAYKITQKNRADAFRKEQAFINNLSSYYQEDFTTIMTRVGQPELLSTQDCLNLLATIPTLKQYALGYYPAIGYIPTNYANLAHISGLVLQAITRSIPHPTGKAVQLNYLTELKKRMHKLTVAIQQALTQQPKMLEYYTLNQ